LSHLVLDYETMIRDAGYRVTAQRVLILDAVCAADGHLSLGEIYARVRQVDKAIDRSTLYRTLKLFVELGLIASADTGDGETYYEIAALQHHHLVCRRCGVEQAIEHALVQSMFDGVLSHYDFTVTSTHLVLFGICAKCRRELDQQHSKPER